MIQIQGRYAWVTHEGRKRLLHVDRDEPGDVKTISHGGWIAFAQALRSEAQMAYDGQRYGPEGIVDALKKQGIPFRSDETQALVLVSVTHFQKFMQHLVLDRESISQDDYAQLLAQRSQRLFPIAPEPKKTKVNKQVHRAEKSALTTDDKPISIPAFSVHPGASIEPWGPMLQTGMIQEAFRELTFYWHDCNVHTDLISEYRVLSVLDQDAPFAVTNRTSWPQTNCRILVASQPLPSNPGVQRDRWVLPAPSRFLIVDNYEYRGVRQITLLPLTNTQVPFFLCGLPPQVIKLAKKARGDLHQKAANASAVPALPHVVTTTEFSSKPKIVSPTGDWQNNPAVIAWLSS